MHVKFGKLKPRLTGYLTFNTLFEVEDFRDLSLQTLMWVLMSVLGNKSWGHFIIRLFAADYSWWLNQVAG